MNTLVWIAVAWLVIGIVAGMCFGQSVRKHRSTPLLTPLNKGNDL